MANTPQQSLEQALEHCLQDLACTGDVEASLVRYPSYADQLRPLLELAQVIQGYYGDVPEAPGRLASGRERLLAAAAQQRARATLETSEARARTTRRKMRLTFATRLVGILAAVVMGVTALGGGMAWAANDSLPGDPLYPVKTTVEDMRLALTSAPEDQVDLALRFVEERVEEIQGLLEVERQVPDEAITRMEQHVEQALVYAAWVPSDEEMADVLGQITVRTRIQAQILEQMQLTASQQTRARLGQAAAICRRGAEAAEAGLSDSQAFRWRYRHQLETPGPTNGSRMMTVTPGSNQEQQRCGQEHECTPVGTPHMTPQGPQATESPNTPRAPRTTPEPRPTSRTPRPTPEPQPTSQKPQPTPEPQPTAQNPQSTSEPQSTPQKPQTTPHEPQATPNPQTTPGPRATPQGSRAATPKPQPTPQGP